MNLGRKTPKAASIKTKASHQFFHLRVFYRVYTLRVQFNRLVNKVKICKEINIMGGNGKSLMHFSLLMGTEVFKIQLWQL